MAGIRIKSNNFNGESVEITFNPFSGGTINLGTQTIPYDYLSSNYEGNYSIYIPSANKTCPLQVGVAPSPTPSITPTSTITPTPSITPSASVPAGDPDANAYLADVVASGGTTNPTIEAAVQTLFTDLKSNGLYSKLYTMYPMVGGTASSHAINANLNKSYDLTFNGGFTHDVSGSTGNGTNGWANTQFGNQTFPQDDYSLGFYQYTENSPSGYLVMGQSIGGSFVRIQIGTDYVGNTYFIRSNGAASTQTSNGGNIDGFYTLNRTGSTTSDLFRNGNTTPVLTLTASYTKGGTDYPIGLWAWLSGTTPGLYANQGLNFAFIGQGLSNSEVSTLSTIINTFQTTLGRNTY